MFCNQVGKKRRRRKKRPMHGLHVKAGAKSRGDKDVKRSEKAVSAAEKVDEAMQNLPNPFDEMSIDEKKQMALFLCKRRLKVCDFFVNFADNFAKSFTTGGNLSWARRIPE